MLHLSHQPVRLFASVRMWIWKSKWYICEQFKTVINYWANVDMSIQNWKSCITVFKAVDKEWIYY